MGHEAQSVPSAYKSRTMLKAHWVIIMSELGAQLFRAVDRVRGGIGNTAHRFLAVGHLLK